MEKPEIAPVGEFRLLTYKKFPDGCRSRNPGLDPPTTKKGEPATRVSEPLEPMLNTEISFELKSATKRNFPPASVTNPRGPLASTGKGEPVTSVNLPLLVLTLNTRTKLPVKSETNRNRNCGSATSPSASFGPGKVPAFRPKGRVRVPFVVSTLKSAIWFNAVVYRNSGLTGGTQLVEEEDLLPPAHPASMPRRRTAARVFAFEGLELVFMIPPLATVLRAPGVVAALRRYLKEPPPSRSSDVRDRTVACRSNSLKPLLDPRLQVADSATFNQAVEAFGK